MAINPLYFSLSLTFMTDVPFFAFSMAAIYFLLRALRTDHFWDFLLGYAFSLAAIFIRQLAIIIPFSFLLVAFIKYRWGRKVFPSAFLPAVALAGLLVIYPAVLQRTIGLPALYNRAYEPITEIIPLDLVHLLLSYIDRLLVEFMYLGLFILPFIFIQGINLRQIISTPKRRLSSLIGLVLFIMLLFYFLSRGRTIPLIGNIVFNIGLGPLLLRDTYLLNLPHWPSIPKVIWLFITIAAAVGSIVLIVRLWKVLFRLFRSIKSAMKVEQGAQIFLLTRTLLYVLVIAITGFLDRYLIWLLPLLMSIILVYKNHIRWQASFYSLSIGLLLIAIFAIFALGGTHDYLAWNRVRWRAVTELTEKDGISYNNIDGGFEFNGWYAYDPFYNMGSSKSWWWVQNDDYMISLGPLANYQAIKQYRFDRWIPPGNGNLFVLQRITE